MKKKKVAMLLELPFPKGTLKRAFTKHKVKEETQISEEGLERLSSILDELIGWIVRESEKLATNGGKFRVTPEHIDEAVKIYFGEGEQKIE